MPLTGKSYYIVKAELLEKLKFFKMNVKYIKNSNETVY